MADTLTEMIFGFAVILGVLGAYILILAVRMRQARSKYHVRTEKYNESQENSSR